jgi:hypothetical protein
MKLKTLSLVLGTALSLFAVSAQAEEAVSSAAPAVAPAEAQSGSAVMDADGQYGCYAWTTCWNGATIACQTYGQGCTWWTNPGYSVQCTGFDYWGRWVNVFYRCY